MSLPLVSVIIPAHNAAPTLAETLDSVVQQDYAGHIEISVYDDCSSDQTLDVLKAFAASNQNDRLKIKWQSGDEFSTSHAHGPSFGRNRAIANCSGEYLCFLDADDIALPHRVRTQLTAALAEPEAILGGRYSRIPEGSTPTYTQWANSLTQDEVYTQCWRECTLVQPTWFMHRRVFERLGGYDEVQPPLHGDHPHPHQQPEVVMPPAAGSTSSVVAQHDMAFRRTIMTRTLDWSKLMNEAIAANTATSSSTMTSSATIADGPARSSEPHQNSVGAGASPQVAAGPSPLTSIDAALRADGFAAANSNLSSIAPWPAAEAEYRHPAILSRPPLKIHPLHLNEHYFSVGADKYFGEDPMFLQRHLSSGGKLILVPETLIVYRYSGSSLSWSVPRTLLLKIRVAMFEERYLAPRRRNGSAAAADATTASSSSTATSDEAGTASLSSDASTTHNSDVCSPLWASGFTIWSAGRDGKAFYNALSPVGKAQVVAFCDLDPKKIGQVYPIPVKAPKQAQQKLSKPKPHHNTRELLELAEHGQGDAASASASSPAHKRPRQDGVAAGAASDATDSNDVRPQATATVASALVPAVGPRPIIHFSKAQLPIVCCVNLESGGDQLRANVASLAATAGCQAVEGENFIFFV